jgi:hypothetical protein
MGREGKESNEDTQWLKRLLVGRPNRAHPQHPKKGRARDQVQGKVQDRVLDPAAVPVPADALAAGQADAASFSVARRSASSVRRRLTQSRIATCGCCKDLWPSAARLCPAGSRVFARRINDA